MKKLFFSLLALWTITTQAQEIINDNNATKRSLSGSFTGISVSDGIDVFLSQGNEESIAVSASDPKYLDRFKTEVEDGVLKIYFDNKGFNWNNNNKRELTAYVSFKNLGKLKISSGADVHVKGAVTSADLMIDLSSGAHFDGTVKTGSLSVEGGSGAGVNINGNTDKLKVDMSSGAIFKGYELNTDYCEAKASSGGGVRIAVAKELNAKASSGGGIHYKGEPAIKDLNVSSGGTVKKG